MQLNSRTQLNRKPRHDAGFTLIELLISVGIIGIIGIITVPLANSVIGVIRSTDDTSSRLAMSHDAQISAAYFAQDVAAVGTRDATVAYLPFKASIQVDPLGVAYNVGPTCGTAATPPAIVRLLADNYDTTTSPATQQTDVVAYYVAVVGTERQLRRMKCRGPSATPASDIAVAHNLGTDLGVGCQTAGAKLLCSNVPPPEQVTMGFTLSKSGQSYPVTLIGQRRQS
jgi:prepilin-type N-terminal cleavage/methylation domain-containing protein